MNQVMATINNKAIESIELTIKTKDEVVTLKDGKVTIHPIIALDSSLGVHVCTLEDAGTPGQRRVWRNKEGKRHRDNDKPAVEYNDGSKYWYQNDVLHREGNQPAIIAYDDGILIKEVYYIQGKPIKTISYANQ